MATEAPYPGATAYLLDAGPLVVALDRGDQHRAWALHMLDRLDTPVLTCEAVVSEACFLARRGGGEGARVLDLLVVLGAQIVPAWPLGTAEVLRR